MKVSGLVGIGDIVEEEKIGVTMPILVSPPKGNKPKLIDQVQGLIQRNYLMQSKARASPPGDCACLLSRTDSMLRFLEM
jgi:hypothetical protein